MRSVRTVILALLFLALLNISLMSWKITPAIAAPDAQKYGGTFVAALQEDPATWNPATHTRAYTHIPQAQIFSALVKFDVKGQPQPDLAESWETSKDGLIMTFHLARNALWHDGVPFTSADVKFGYEQVLIPYHPRGRVNFAVVSSIETPDPYTVVFKLKNPAPGLIFFMGIMYGAIVAKHLFEGTDILKNPQNYDKPIGTGPFKFKEWVKGDHITLVKNENYFKKGLPYLDRVVFKIIPDQASRTIALEKGEVDAIMGPSNLNFAELVRLSTIPGINVTFSEYLTRAVFHLHFNLLNPILKNLKVRQGIAYAINKTAIMDKVRLGKGYVVDGPVEWYVPLKTKYTRDLAKANQLLDEAGYPRGSNGNRFNLGIVLEIPVGENAKIGEVLGDQLADVGIQLDFQMMDAATEMDRVWRRLQFDLNLNTVSHGPDPMAVSGLYLSTQIGKGTATNCMSYNNSRVDYLLNAGAVEPDPKKRMELYSEFQEIVAKELPTILTLPWLVTDVWRTNYAGIPPGISFRDNYEGIWWTKGSELSPEGIQAAIVDAQKQLDSLKGRFYDVTAAQKQLDQAKVALAAGDYMKALELTRDAMNLTQPPYALYAGVATVVIAIVGGAILYKKKTKKAA